MHIAAASLVTLGLLCLPSLQEVTYGTVTWLFPDRFAVFHTLDFVNFSYRSPYAKRNVYTFCNLGNNSGIDQSELLATISLYFTTYLGAFVSLQLLIKNPRGQSKFKRAMPFEGWVMFELGFTSVAR